MSSFYLSIILLTLQYSHLYVFNERFNFKCFIMFIHFVFFNIILIKQIKIKIGDLIILIIYLKIELLKNYKFCSIYIHLYHISNIHLFQQFKTIYHISYFNFNLFNKNPPPLVM